MRLFARWLFPGLLGLSVLAHFWILRSTQIDSSVDIADLPEQPEEIVVVVEELPAPTPEPTPELTPAPTPEPEPTPPPPEPDPTPEPEPTPEPDPEPEAPGPTPTPTPKPKPSATPRPKPVSTPAPKPQATAKPQQKSQTAPTGQVVQARPNTPRNRPPAYPDTARRQGWEGRVMVRASVDPNGKVTAVSVAVSSGYGVLDQAALRAVKGWQFLPKSIGGTPTASIVEVPVNFSLRGR